MFYWALSTTHMPSTQRRFAPQVPRATHSTQRPSRQYSNFGSRSLHSPPFEQRTLRGCGAHPAGHPMHPAMATTLLQNAIRVIVRFGQSPLLLSTVGLCKDALTFHSAPDDRRSSGPHRDAKRKVAHRAVEPVQRHEPIRHVAPRCLPSFDAGFDAPFVLGECRRQIAAADGIDFLGRNVRARHRHRGTLTLQE
jgi:hypothetical protein